MEHFKLKFLLIVSLLVVFITGCSKDSTTTPDPVVAIDVQPSTLNFGDTSMSGATQTFTIYNKGNQPLNITDISSNMFVFSVDFTPSTIEVNSNKTYTTHFVPFSNQNYSGQISIKSNASDIKYVVVTGKGACNGYGVLRYTNGSSVVHKVLIDNLINGQLNPGQTGDFNLPAGSHTINQTRLDGTASCSPGTVIITECGYSLSACNYN